MDLFERIETAVRARHPSSSASHRLVATLGDVFARSQQPLRLLGPLIDAIPELQFVQTELARHPVRATRALGMVLIALTAHVRSLEARSATTRHVPLGSP